MNKGQSTIEFLMVISLALIFLFSFVKFGLLYTNGYLVHYAAFVASRVYMVIDTNSNRPDGSDSPAQARARRVFDSFPLKNLIPGSDMKFSVTAPDSGGNSLDKNLYVGVTANFQQAALFPALSGGNRNLLFRSESFLGREPTRAECVERVCHAIREVGGNCGIHSTVSDNGC